MKNRGMLENGLCQKMLFSSVIFIKTKDLLQDAPSQHESRISKSNVCSMLTLTQNNLLSCKAVRWSYPNIWTTASNSS